ncbi:P1 family peptidase [Bifidobacterium tibiigranuli]|jgi:L-aminopeptidase/D-esterase-like protein|uniref:P1 family peptidase n=1 Tax=Bifidobacterium tibiigranuli TaxID=2172043 RepID=UPI002353832F|nr:P1 family peptidase [Bifidobacterium tibiigranuli]MCH3975227.1 P1 family peptidase [Bifidobacterium tibiigranuli]MCH4203425.1 P1 family peptidase [Bifidobacterium tibiigranuli]MCH4273963.1 P1 family peptidase [Bifidobacterium tibiigranuli]MCI1650594.1 P1 family peptidase [Bifidobacterium tibiigranuli]MCI2186103.1 P1 family peptidase [Bifidobacterium tibiigranuli]
MRHINVVDVRGFTYSHFTNAIAGTGATVFLFNSASPAGVSIRGGGPASRETPLLAPVAAAQGINALVLSGGSAYGLAAAEGVMRFLEESDVGVHIGTNCVPLVCQSCLFDLPIADSKAYPTAQDLYIASQRATTAPFQNGNVGAGTGCSVGKYHGPRHAMKTGIGSYAIELGPIRIGAVVALNALGDIYKAGTNTAIAGMRGSSGAELESTFASMMDDAKTAEANQGLPQGNTTLGAVFTNAQFNKTELTKIAEMAHNGYARTIRPVHTSSDGDSIYAISTGHVAANPDIVGTLAAYVIENAIEVATYSAQGAYGLPSNHDLHL